MIRVDNSEGSGNEKHSDSQSNRQGFKCQGRGRARGSSSWSPGLKRDDGHSLHPEVPPPAAGSADLIPGGQCDLLLLQVLV